MKIQEPIYYPTTYHEIAMSQLVAALKKHGVQPISVSLGDEMEDGEVQLTPNRHIQVGVLEPIFMVWNLGSDLSQILTDHFSLWVIDAFEPVIEAESVDELIQKMISVNYISVKSKKNIKLILNLRKTIMVASIEEAVDKHNKYRDAKPYPASELWDSIVIVDGIEKHLISYNGRVWDWDKPDNSYTDVNCEAKRKYEKKFKKISQKILANKFTMLLRSKLTDAQMKEVVERNKVEKSQHCHSNDFCDANMVMNTAVESFGLKINSASDEHAALWNGAWDLAKNNHFEIYGKIPKQQYNRAKSRKK